MRPTLRQLQYLVAIAETGGFGAAARKLHVSQPSLSALISDMEAELDVVLVERGRRNALLTPAGEEVVRRARSILAEVANLRTVTSNTAATLAGKLRIGVLPSVGPYLLPGAARRLHALYPDLRLFVREERTLDLDRNLADGRFDTIISCPGDHMDCDSAPLFTERIYICVAPDHALAGEGGPLPIGELAGHELLSLGYGFGLSAMAGTLALRAGARVNPEYEGTSLDAVRQMAAMGAGVAILPGLYATTEARRDPDLIIRPIDDPAARRDVALVWRKTSPLASRLGQLAAILRETAESILAIASASTRTSSGGGHEET